jgi:hypothetical protein
MTRLPYCTYCGSEIRETDKFCIYCGKPRIVKSASGSKSEPVAPTPQPKEEPPTPTDQKSQKKSKDKGAKKGGKEVPAEAEQVPREGVVSPPAAKGKAGKKGKGQVAEDLAAATVASEAEASEETTAEEVPAEEAPAEEEEATHLVTELPDDVKEQLEIRMELQILSTKKKKIAEKVAETSKLLDDPQYEIDTKYHNDVNAKIEAIKEVKAEIDQQEGDLNSKLDPGFSLIALPTRTGVLKSQIEELKNNYKLHRVEKDVFDQLNTEYTEELTQDLDSHKNLLTSLKAWAIKLKAERHQRERDVNLAKARFRSREITKEELDDKLAEINLQIEKLDDKLAVMQQFLGKK